MRLHVGDVFNPLKAEEMITAVGGVLRLAADADAPLDDYRRSQLLSAYSVTRNLAAEQAASADLLAWARATLDDLLAGDERPEVAEARRRAAAARDGVELGEVVAELLEGLRRDEPEGRLRADVQAVLAELTDREVDALARGTR